MMKSKTIKSTVFERKLSSFQNSNEKCSSINKKAKKRFFKKAKKWESDK